MTSLFDKLNLRPGERRLVVGVAIVIFAVLNIALIFPRFGDWGRTEQRIKDASARLKMFKDELTRRSDYERRLNFLKEQGTYVASEEQALQLIREVTSQAALDQVQLPRQEPSRTPTGTRTNSFFEEQSFLVTFNATETNLVNFLFNLGSRNSLIRVRSMQIGRDPSGTRLQGSITFVESFQKKPPPKITQLPTTAAAKPAPAAPPPKAAEPVKTVKPTERPKTTPAPLPAKPAVAPPPTRAPTATVPSPIAPKPTNLPKRVVPPPEKAR